MIKKIIVPVLLCLFSFCRSQNQVADLLSVPGPIEYDGTEYFLVWSKPISKTLYRQQYLPRDERIEDFTHLLDFSFFTKEIDMELAVRQKVESIQQRSGSDRYAKVNVTESPDGSEYIVDYYISETPEKGNSFVEYNIYRFKGYNDGTDKSFLILSYAERIYGDLKSAARTLSRQRDHLLATMIEYKIPEIKVPQKN